MRTNILRKAILALLLLVFTAGSAGAKTMKGDLNGDKNLNVSDVMLLVNIILGGDVQSYNTYAADVNGDGDITVSDVQLLVNVILNGGTIDPGIETGDFSDDPAIGPALAPSQGKFIGDPGTPSRGLGVFSTSADGQR